MKKYLMTAPLLALLTACSGGSGDTENQSTPVDTFMSADLAFADLRGDVSQCKTVTTDLTKANGKLQQTAESAVTTLIEKFDDYGFIASVVNSEVFQGETMFSSTYSFNFDGTGALMGSSTSDEGSIIAKRDDNGFVSYFAPINETGDKDYVKAYEWKDGRLISEKVINTDRADLESEGDFVNVSNKISYMYDPKGYRTGAVEDFGSSATETTVTETWYGNDSIDACGNWTHRTITKIANIYRGNDRDKPLSSDTSYLMQKRIITYRK